MKGPSTDPRELADAFVRALDSELGGRLRAATLFGSAARGEWIEGVSDVNVLVLVDTIDATLLGAIAPAARDALSRGVTPLLMELDEWARAADVFTIELADMKDAGVVLFGDDPAAGAELQPATLRLQAERELRAKLLHLHAGMLLAADDRERLGQLLVHALPSFTTYLRAALRLAGQAVPRTSRDVIMAGCTLAGAEPDAFLAVHDARSGRRALELDLTDPVTDRFNAAATRLAAFIDAFGR
jgi:predicted nucleotidyltransferase